MLINLTIIMILISIYSISNTIKTILRIQELQNSINQELKYVIESVNKRTTLILEMVHKHVEDEEKIYNLLSNFGEDE